jgi:hypothetical protein
MTTVVRWPADRFFWAILDAPGVRAWAGQTMPEGLRPLLQEDLPSPVDQVHAVAVSLPDGKVLVCAAPRGELGELAESCLRLSPECLPPDLTIEPGVDTGSLNLLVGDFEPRTLRRERAKRRMLVSLTAAALACLLAVGLVRRAEAWGRTEREARTAVSTLGATPAVLHVELERLRKAPRPGAHATSSPDAAVALAGLLASWPRQLECQTDSVNVGSSTMTLSLTVTKDARPFLSALKPPEGWILEEPRLTSSGEGARLNLVLRRKESRS